MSPASTPRRRRQRSPKSQQTKTVTPLLVLGLLITALALCTLYTTHSLPPLHTNEALYHKMFENTTYHSSEKHKRPHKRIHRTKDGKEVVEMVEDDLVAALPPESDSDAQSERDSDNDNDSDNNMKKENIDISSNNNNIKKAAVPRLRANAQSASTEWPAPRLTTESTVILVLSARKHVELRQVIRETWGNGHDNVYFVIGQYCPVNQAHRHDQLECETPPELERNKHDEWYEKRMQLESQVLREEQEHYRDMLWTPSPESYRGLPHKVKEGYDWIVRNLPNTKWIVKADDDTIVRVKSLSQYLETLAYTKPTIIGKIEYEGVVWKEGKWKEEKYTKSDQYPPFPLGSCGHVVSRPVAQYIAQHKSTLIEYQGEDTSVGIWMDESPLQVDVYHSESFDNNGKCENPNLFVIGHDLSIDRIRECYRIGDEVQPIVVKQFG